MAKTHKAIQEAIKEGRRRHLARYYDPGQKPGIDSATIHKWQFEQAMTNLVAMLGSYNDIGVDWGMDDDAMCSSLPFPGVGTLCNQTAENAIRNYIGIVTTYDDVEELCAKVAQSQWIVQIRTVLARMTWYLHHEGPDSCAKKLAAEGHEKEAIAMLREIVSRACEDGLTELKRLLAEYELCQHAESPNNADPWRVQWDETDKDYEQSGEARVDFTDGKLSASYLSKNLGKIPVHYMQKPGKGARVHLGEFRVWAKGKNLTDTERSEIADEWFADKDARQADERAKKQHK